MSEATVAQAGPEGRADSIQKLADALVSQAREAAAIFTQYGQEEVDRIVAAAAKAGAARRIELAQMAAEETAMGVWEDKVIKNLFSTEYVYDDIRHVRTVGLVRECPEASLMEYAEPLGVVLGVIPVTNPTSTTMFKSLLALKTRNALIISPSPKAQRCTIEAARTMYEAALAAGAPDYCIGWVEKSSHELTHLLMTSPKVSLILATGGMGLVHAAYSSGTPAIGVGPGNVPVYIHSSANIPSAVNDILVRRNAKAGAGAVHDGRTGAKAFWLQPTKSFENAPQREEYEDDESFARACKAYGREWRETYFCEDANCQNRDCPQH